MKDDDEDDEIFNSSEIQCHSDHTHFYKKI